MASKQRSCIPIIIMVLLITTIVEDVLVHGWVNVNVGVRIGWGAQKRKRDNGKNTSYNLFLPCGIERFDANSDGYLDLDEFATAAKLNSSDPILIDGFARLDKNGDSKLSIEEQIQAMPSRCAKKEFEAIKEKAEKAGVSI